MLCHKMAAKGEVSDLEGLSREVVRDFGLELDDAIMSDPPIRKKKLHEICGEPSTVVSLNQLGHCHASYITLLS